MSRVVKAARLRLGMRTRDGREVVGISRPDPATVKRGYGRVWVDFADEGSRRPMQGWLYYPSDDAYLADDDDSPEDLTMDEWEGRWW